MSKTTNLPKTPPSYLDDTAKSKYKRVLPLLVEIDASAIDLQAVVGYCQSVSLWRQAQQVLKRHGATIITPNKSVQINPYHTIGARVPQDEG